MNSVNFNPVTTQPAFSAQKPTFGHTTQKQNGPKKETVETLNTFSSYALLGLATIGAALTASKLNVPVLGTIARRGLRLTKVFFGRMYQNVMAFLKSPQIKEGIETVTQVVSEKANQLKDAIKPAASETIH